MDAEQGILGCIMLQPPESIAICIEKFRPGPEVFFDLRHRLIYATLISMWDMRVPIDLITLHQTLTDRGELSNVGGMEYLAGLPDRVPSAANLDYYTGIVVEKFTLRRLHNVCKDIADRALTDPRDVPELIAVAASAIQSVTDSTTATNAAKPASVLVERVRETIESIAQNQGQITGLTTGFRDLDSMTWGMHPTDMIVIAARPSVGKTSLAMNIAEHVAVNLNTAVGIFSLEMSDESLMMRCMCSRARVSSRQMREGMLNQEEWARLAESGEALWRAPMFIDDSSGLTILQLRAKARRMAQMHNIRLFVIDYLQLMQGNGRRSDSRQNEVSEISSGVKALAKELRVPVIVLAQLNRKLEERGPNAKPKLSDLRESGSIEQDADVVGLLYNDEDRQPDRFADAIPVNLLVAKHRNGPTGNVRLTFLKSCTRFESQSRIEPSDMGPTNVVDIQPQLPYSDPDDSR